MSVFTLAVLIIAIALVFDYINGFHDAANSIATIVATRVLTPFQAVLWAAFFNFCCGLPLRHGGGQDGGQGLRGPQPGHALRDHGRPDGRHRLGPDHLVARPAHQFVARLDRRVRRRRHGARGPAARLRPQSGSAQRQFHRRMALHLEDDRRRAADRPGFRLHPDGGGLLAVPQLHPVEDGQVFPQAPVGFGGGIQPGARLQRCAEDRRNHHRRALHFAVICTPSKFRSGCCWPPTRRSRWAR